MQKTVLIAFLLIVPVFGFGITSEMILRRAKLSTSSPLVSSQKRGVVDMDQLSAEALNQTLLAEYFKNESVPNDLRCWAENNTFEWMKNHFHLKDIQGDSNYTCVGEFQGVHKENGTTSFTAVVDPFNVTNTFSFLYGCWGTDTNFEIGGEPQTIRQFECGIFHKEEFSCIIEITSDGMSKVYGERIRIQERYVNLKVWRYQTGPHVGKIYHVEYYHLGACNRIEQVNIFEFDPETQLVTSRQFYVCTPSGPAPCLF